MSQTSKIKFLDRIRLALGRESDSNVDAIKQEFFMNPEPAYRDALSDSIENAEPLIDEFKENAERYNFLKWSQSNFNNFRVIPPGNGICHQVNLEYLAQVVSVKKFNNFTCQTKSPNYFEIPKIRHLLKYIILNKNPNMLAKGMVFREVDYAIYEVL